MIEGISHGHTNGRKQSPTYVSWRAMKSRCLNPKHKDYKYYGGAGVQFCEQWRDFTRFLADVGVRPEGTTLDRYPDKTGDYEPGNVRWATSREQHYNRRSRNEWQWKPSLRYWRKTLANDF